MNSEEIKPELFGKYILLDKIATGGMAEIYLAKAPGAENVTKFIAIKRILPQYSSNQEFIDMFKEEAKIAIHLSHSNIVPIFEFGMENKLFYIAMEFVDGKNLRQILNRLKKEKKNLTIPQIVYMIKEASKGLDHAHRCVDGSTGTPLNITHRDISPQNIMLSYEGEIKIIDFGIAKAESKIEATRAGTLKGKFGYMSPEQAEGYEVDYRTDIFSLGIVLWELLANDRLFVANTEINTLKKIRECHIPSLKKINAEIPHELERIVMKALAREKTLRYQSSDELAQDLQIFLNKHYPEFSHRDLAFTLKEIFVEEREEIRQKMIEYAKIKMNLDEKTEMISDVTQTVTETNSEVNPASDDSLRLNLNAEKNIDSFNFKFEREELVNKPSLKRRGQNNPNLSSFRDKTSSKINIQKNSTPNRNTNTQTTSNYTYTDTSVLLKRKNNSSTKFFIYLLLLLSGSYYMYENPDSINQLIGEKSDDSQTQSSTNNTNQNKPPIQPQEIFYNLLVTSVPSGAEIFIDEKPTKVFTPGQVRVPANKQYTLKIEKENFMVEKRSIITMKQGDELRVTLKRIEQAFVNVSVSGGSAAIYVNGKKISDRAPVIRYPVIANTPIKIQAYNPQNKMYAEKQVELAPNTVGQIQLKLNEARSPSNRK